jgi:hypothetical protein
MIDVTLAMIFTDARRTGLVHSFLWECVADCVNFVTLITVPCRDLCNVVYITKMNKDG